MNKIFVLVVFINTMYACNSIDPISDKLRDGSEVKHFRSFKYPSEASKYESFQILEAVTIYNQLPIEKTPLSYKKKMKGDSLMSIQLFLGNQKVYLNRPIIKAPYILLKSYFNNDGTLNIFYQQWYETKVFDEIVMDEETIKRKEYNPQSGNTSFSEYTREGRFLRTGIFETTEDMKVDTTIVISHQSILKAVLFDSMELINEKGN